jgi:hypothetical protein
MLHWQAWPIRPPSESTGQVRSTELQRQVGADGPIQARTRAALDSCVVVESLDAAVSLLPVVGYRRGSRSSVDCDPAAALRGT